MVWIEHFMPREFVVRYRQRYVLAGFCDRDGVLELEITSPKILAMDPHRMRRELTRALEFERAQRAIEERRLAAVYLALVRRERTPQREALVTPGLAARVRLDVQVHAVVVPAQAVRARHGGRRAAPGHRARETALVVNCTRGSAS